MCHIHFTGPCGFSLQIITSSFVIVRLEIKWIEDTEVYLMQNGTSASEIISKLKEFFSIFGLLIDLIWHTGTLFFSYEFIYFCQSL